MKPLLFAYGTLITGTPNARLNRLVDRYLIPVCRGSIRARLYDLGPYPGAVPSARRTERVEGWLFAVKNARRTFHELDRYEDYVGGRESASEFVRRRCTVTCADGDRRVRAWVYYFNGVTRNRRAARRERPGGPRS